MCASTATVPLAVEPFDVGFGDRVTVGEVVQDLGVHDRVRLEDPMIGLRQPVPPEVAVDHPEQAPEDSLGDGEREVRTLRGEHVGLEEIEDGLWVVHFGPLELGLINDRALDSGVMLPRSSP